MSTLNTKNNMFGMAGILDSEKINPKANDRLFIDPDTRADACNQRIKQLKQRQLELAPYAKSESGSEEGSSGDEDECSSLADIQFEHQSSASAKSKTSSRSFQKSSRGKKTATPESSSGQSRDTRSRRASVPVKPAKLASEGIPSELSARQFQNNPFAMQCLRSDLLDDIYELKSQLVDEGVNIDNLEIPRVDQAPDIETLRLIKGILLRKTRKLQSNSIVEDILFMMLKGVEQLFDGKTEVFGAKPNLKGLTKALTLKFRNQRQHFTSILEEVCEKYGVGANSKLIAQMTISSIKRAIINKDHTEDYSANMKQLQTMYSQRQ